MKARPHPDLCFGYYYDSDSNLYYLQSRYYDPELGRFINADSYASTGQGLLGYNMFAYCRSNPVIRKDATGTDDICVTTDDDNPFDDLGIPGMGSGGGGGGGSFGQCGWSTFVNTMQSAANGLSMAMGQRNVAYAATRTPVTVYRSVSSAEAQDIRNTGRFNLVPGGMESKQFGFDLVETQKFGAMMGQNIIVCVDVPTSMLGELYTGGVDTSIFRSGTLTVYDNQLDAFNQVVQGTIKFVP